MIQVAVYVDGFNLYHGLKAKHGRRYLWLDLETVAKRLLKPGQQLTSVKYFTARIRNDQLAQARQSAYLGALAQTDVEIVLGRFQEKHRDCWKCGATWRAYEEKETDVSIAVSLLEDGVVGRFDTALLISADSDLCPAVRSLKRLRPELLVVAVFPPKRRSDDLRAACDAAFTLGDSNIRRSQLPQNVSGSDGTVYARPRYWR